MLMWSYGSNLCIDQMRSRCPRAKFKGPLTVYDAALVFRGVADVVLRDGSFVPGGLWAISRECERALDRYEGVSNGVYVKRYFHLRRNKQVVDVLFYQMTNKYGDGVMPPGQGYFDTIAQGYRDFGLDLDILEKYLQESWDRRRITNQMLVRYESRGRPTLATDLDRDRIGESLDTNRSRSDYPTGTSYSHRR